MRRVYLQTTLNGQNLNTELYGYDTMINSNELVGSLEYKKPVPQEEWFDHFV